MGVFEEISIGMALLQEIMKDEPAIEADIQNILKMINDVRAKYEQAAKGT